jgi:hypothetical protein
MKLPKLNVFCDIFAHIFFIFPSICPNFHGFRNLFFWGGGAVALPPVLDAHVFTETQSVEVNILALFTNTEVKYIHAATPDLY